MSEAAAVGGFASLLSDEGLTRRAVSGDERAFAAIFRRYHQSLYRYCLAIVGNSQDAQDALQNTMMKVLRALPGEDRKIELRPWLYRIAHNESIDLLRRRRETRVLDVEQIAPGYGLAEKAETRERLRSLVADLKELPERQREVLVMRELSGLEFEEIGAALDTSGAVVRQTLYEARQSLRQMEEGREMDCATVSKALSDGDGRVTRRREVRAHLRACADCRAFREEIKGRQRDFAALSPLPAVAAAGMLKGLLGGSQGATGGGLAATLGGGAAKTIGASAAAKGLATATVVAAIGVTAADRTGVIHLGLPGERSSQPAKQESAPPGAGTTKGQSAPKVGEGSAAGSAKRGKAGGAAGRQNAQTVAGAATGKGAAHNQASQASTPGSSAEHLDAATNEDLPGYGPGVEHASGQDHEKQYPPAATNGQETASAHQPSSGEPSGGDGSNGNGSRSSTGAEHAATPTKPSHPSTPGPPTHAPPEEAPANPPAAAPGNPTPELPPPAAENGPPETPPGLGGKGKGPS
jgi:RNA polymerase sigma factor (sigma-70 family)